ncbi:MAG: hypothetical protein OXG37_04140 [Actinomycetia bacterium]|nr:hypothetical protein [Actinomycetes bacterium]
MPRMGFEVSQYPHHDLFADAFVVKAINFAGEGENYSAVFFGHLAEERAEHYARVMSSQYG